MGDRQYDEKDEKELRKHEEKAEEKSAEEKGRRDPLGTLIWALILIWVGLVLLAETAGLLEAVRLGLARLPFDITVVSPTVWTLIFGGIGVLLLVEVVVRLSVPAYRRSVVGTVIGAGITFGLALGAWWLIGPVILIAVGLAMLLRGVSRPGE